MTQPGIFIRNVQSLERLEDIIGSSSEAMSRIDLNVSNYLNGVREKLEGQLDIIQMKLAEAEARLSEAESALTVCQASQAMALMAGAPGPSCMMEESAVEAARAEVENWRVRYEQGQQIVGECCHEIGEYNGPSGGHSLIMRMCEQQTPKATQQLLDCIAKLQDILGYDVTDSVNKGTNSVSTEPVSSYSDENRVRDIKKHFRV